MNLPQDLRKLTASFRSSGAIVTLDPEVEGEERTVSVSYNGRNNRYRIPNRTAVDRIPAWFWVGVWEDMSIPYRNDQPGSGYLDGWGFRNVGGGIFEKNILGSTTILQYNGCLVVKDEGTYSVEDYPSATVYHAMELFERSGWFDNEAPVNSEDIDAYKVIVE